MTEVDGKATGWRAFYNGGKWEEVPAPKKKGGRPRRKGHPQKSRRKVVRGLTR